MIDQILLVDQMHILFFADHGPHLMNKQNNEDFVYQRSISTILAMKTDKVCQQLTNNKKLFQVNIFRHIFNCIGLEKI